MGENLVVKAYQIFVVKCLLLFCTITNSVYALMYG